MLVVLFSQLASLRMQGIEQDEDGINDRIRIRDHESLGIAFRFLAFFTIVHDVLRYVDERVRFGKMFKHQLWVRKDKEDNGILEGVAKFFETIRVWWIQEEIQ